MKAYLSLLLAIVAPSLANELQARGGGGDDGWGGGGGGGWGTTTEIIYTTSKLFNLNFSFSSYLLTWTFHCPLISVMS